MQELKAAGLLDSVDVALDKLGGIPTPGENEDDDGQIDLEEAIADSEREATGHRDDIDNELAEGEADLN